MSLEGWLEERRARAGWTLEDDKGLTIRHYTVAAGGTRAPVLVQTTDEGTWELYVPPALDTVDADETLRRASEQLDRGQKDLKAILEAHAMWLRGDGGYRADLSGADLYGVALPDADLRRAKLSGTCLSGADLYGVDMRDADLRGVDMSGADMKGADMSGAALSGAKLSGANLINSDLRYAKLRGATLRYATLRYAKLSGADLSGADLTEAVVVPDGRNWEQASTFRPEAKAALKAFTESGLLQPLPEIPNGNAQKRLHSAIYSTLVDHCDKHKEYPTYTRFEGEKPYALDENGEKRKVKWKVCLQRCSEETYDEDLE
jgi:hypothetical protein